MLCEHSISASVGAIRTCFGVGMVKAWLCARAKQVTGCNTLIWLYVEYPDTGLIHPGFIHGRYASQRMGLVALLALSFTYSEEACSEE